METIQGFLNPLLEQLGNFVPGLVGALVILFIGWVIAKLVSKGIGRVLGKANVNQRVNQGGGDLDVVAMASSIVYYLLMLFVLMFVLNSLGYESVLAPIQAMYDSVLGMIPNIIGAALIGFVGYVVAKILSTLVGVAGKGLDSLMSRVGVEGVSLSRILSIVVFILVLTPSLLAAFEKLNIAVISEPATQMLNAVLVAIPNVLAAAIILAVAFVLGRFISSSITQLLSATGADSVPSRVGVEGFFSENMPFSKFVGSVLFFFVMMGAAVAAVEQLEFAMLSTAISQVLEFGANVVMGLVILGVGNLLATLAYNALQSTGSNFAQLARFAILGLVLAMGLRAMGFADDIVTLAFGLTLGAIAVAVALSFGLGGRQAAGNQMERWFTRMQPMSTDPSQPTA